MAASSSGLIWLTWRDILKNDTAIDLLADTLKVTLFSNSITNDIDTDTAYGAAPYNANEVGTAGGVALSSPTLTVVTGHLLTFDAADTSWSTQTFSGARAALLYDDTITTPVADPAIAIINLGADYGVTSGVFQLQWPSGGIFYTDLG